MTGLVRLDPALVSLEPLIAEGPAMTRTANLFEPGAGLSAGIWEADAFTEEIDAYPCDEVCVVLEGTIHIDMDGTRHSFGPGEALAISAGTPCIWHQDDRVRKFYVIRERLP